jgi:hypothetical protein
MIQSKIDHVGIVVPHLERAIENLAAQLGYDFEIVFEAELPVQVPGSGDRSIPLRIAFSTQRPGLEIIEAVAGTPWAPENAGLHHLAFFAEDLDADSTKLAGLCPIEVSGAGLFTYHTGGIFRVELLAQGTG